MKILLASAWYLPDSVGGTEIYTHELAKVLISRGHSVRVFTPHYDSKLKADDNHDGVPITRYPVAVNPEMFVVSGSEPESHLNEFAALVNQYNPDVYHQQTVTWACGKYHLKAVSESGIKTVLTAHIPGIVCLNNEMLLMGKNVCSGIISENPCFSCHLHVRKGFPASLSILMDKISSSLPESVKRKKPVFNVLEEKINELQYVNKYSDKVVAVCRWLFDALKLNGIEEKKLLLSRQGVDLKKYQIKENNSSTYSKLRILFIGRITSVKGIHILIQAVQNVNADLVDLAIVGKAIPEDQEYETYWKRKSTASLNIDWRGKLNPEEINLEFEKADILCVPSIWLETGPLVVYEAFAKGLPVLGSDLGGIAELVQHGKDGYLVEPNNVEALEKAILKLVDKSFLGNLKKKVSPPRSSEKVGEEMEDLYTGLKEK